MPTTPPRLAAALAAAGLALAAGCTAGGGPSGGGPRAGAPPTNEGGRGWSAPHPVKAVQDAG
ncbi:hypothetical protein ABZ806_21730, partial [Spirillospora sp. NPDC047418]